jgi:hypothetical protein
MTLGLAWIRVVGSVRELIVASDSRLAGGQWWDANPKTMLLPRSDCVLSFSGHTYDAYRKRCFVAVRAGAALSAGLAAPRARGAVRRAGLGASRSPGG